MLAASATLGAPPVSLYVDSSGSDLADGSEAHPFATLERARDAIRAAKKQGGATRSFTVWLRGTFTRSSSFVLTDDDAGAAGAPIVYRGRPGEWVTLTGGREIGPFVAVTDENTLAHFDPYARRFVRFVDLRKSGLDPTALKPNFSGQLTVSGASLYYDNAPMTVASWPNQDWSHIVSLPTGNLSGRFEYEGDRPSRWTHTADIFLHGFWKYDWFDSYETILAIDPTTRQIQTNYAALPGAYGFLAGQRYRALNVMEELDQPGEWYLDRTGGVLYFWPPDNEASRRTVLSVFDEPLVVLRGTSYVTLEGLVLENNRSSAVEITGSSHTRVAACLVRNMGVVGISIGAMKADLRYTVGTGDPLYSDDPGFDNGIDSCLIFNTGKGGVLLGGGDRRTLSPGGNFVVNSEIHDFSMDMRTGGAAVLMYGVGNRVEHNKIYNGPQTAIFMWGNNHSIAYNDISRVCREVADAGAIYYGRDYSQRGTVIHNNYVHDIPGVDGGYIGVYLDDLSSGTAIFKNIFARVSFGVNVGGGRENRVDNNVFIDCGRAIHMDARGLTWVKSYFDGTDTTLLDRLRLVKFDQPPYSAAYPLLPDILKDDPGVPKYNLIVHNIIFGGKGITFADEAAKYVDVNTNFIGDPIFDAASPGQYRLANGSPARFIGYEPISTGEIGPQPTQTRSALPQQPARKRSVSH